MLHTTILKLQQPCMVHFLAGQLHNAYILYSCIRCILSLYGYMRLPFTLAYIIETANRNTSDS